MESYILYAARQDWGFYVNSRFSEDKKSNWRSKWQCTNIIEMSASIDEWQDIKIVEH